MSKQHPKDAAFAVDIHNLMICDGGWDSLLGREFAGSQVFTHERRVTMSRVLSDDEALALLRWAQSHTPAPGLNCAMISYEACPSEYTFLTSEQ